MSRLPFTGLWLARAVVGTSTGHAETNTRNLAVATRAVGFLEPKLSGRVPVAIAYSANDGASEADAKDIARGLAAAPVNGISFAPQLVASTDLAAIKQAKVVFVAANTGNQAAIFAASSDAHAVTVSFDLACVNAGRCVVGIRSAPKVEIVVSRTARLASHVSFSQAFLMLVTEQ